MIGRLFYAMDLARPLDHQHEPLAVTLAFLYATVLHFQS
jgi:hypothetical protein